MTIKPQRAGKIPPESAADRGIIVRPGVGAVGRIVQRAELTSHRVVVSAATLILIRSGRKKVRSSFRDCIGKPGDAIAIGAGETVDITNTPGLEGAYRAQWITWPDSAIESFSQANRSKDFLSGAVVLPRLSNDFLATYEAAFQSLLDIKGIPTTVANHRSHEVLLWLQSLGVQFRSKVYETLSMRVRRIMAGDPAREWTIDEVARQEHSSAAASRGRGRSVSASAERSPNVSRPCSLAEHRRARSIRRHQCGVCFTLSVCRPFPVQVRLSTFGTAWTPAWRPFSS